MRRSLVVCLLSLAALLGLHVCLFFVWPPGSSSEARLRLATPFRAEQGSAWQGHLPVPLPSDRDAPGRSPLRLREDGVALGPAHAAHATIRERGGGAFSHWGEVLYFSTSDGSDPNTNGRTYVVDWSSPVAIWPHLAVVLVDLLLALLVGLWLLSRPGSWGRTRRSLRPWFAAAVAAIVVDLLGDIVYRHRLAAGGETIAALVDAVFGGGADRSFHGESVQYAEHHYLNYVLNPAFQGGVGRQFEREHRIRRTEPLRPRDRVSWRILVLGGSTTYGERLDDEADTWVHRLERKLRSELGPDVEVINGGVGGYNVLENTIHYGTLLSRLEPDVVLLYVGINDVHPRLFGTLTSDYANYRVPWRSDGYVLPPPVAWLRWSGAYRLYYLGRHVEPLRRTGIGGLAAKDYPDAATWAESLARNGPGVFRDHLQNLVLLLKAQGRKVGVLPQHFVTARPEDAVFATGVQQHNAVNREVAQRLGVPFAQRLEEGGGFARDDTFDSCHFNAAGSERMAILVAGFLREQALLPR